MWYDNWHLADVDYQDSSYFIEMGEMVRNRRTMNEETIWKYSWNNFKNRRIDSWLLLCECMMIAVMVVCLISAIIMNTPAYWVFSFIVGGLAFIVCSMMELMRDHIIINDKLDKLLITKAKHHDTVLSIEERYK